MSRLGLGILIILFSQYSFSKDKLKSEIDVVFNANVESIQGLIPIKVMINNNESDNAWLDINDTYKFIFPNKTRTTTDMAVALSTMTPSRSLIFTCENSDVEFCSNYKLFDFSYDFETGTLSIFYETAKFSSQDIDSEPALSLHQSLLFSESTAMSTYRSGQWNGLISTGLSESSFYDASVMYDIERSSLDFDKFDLFYKENNSRKYSLYYNNRSSSMLSKLDAINTKGLSVHLGKDNEIDDISLSPIMLYAKNDGVFNIYDEFSSFVSTMTALQGLNRIVLPPNIKGNYVRIELVVNGEINEEFKFPLTKYGYWGKSFRLDAGVTKIINQNITSRKNNDDLYIALSNSTQSLKTDITAIPKINSYATSLSFIGSKNLNVGIESVYKENMLQHDISGSISLSYIGNDFVFSGSKNISHTPKNTFSAGITRRLFENSRFEIYYNQSKSVYVKCKGMSKKDFTYNMLSARYNTKYQSIIGLFDFNISAGTDMGSDRKIGFSINYQPTSTSIYKPTLGIQYDKNSTQTNISNELNISDGLQILPEIRFSDRKLTQFGSSINYNDQFINSNYSYFKAKNGHDMHINANSHAFISSQGISNSINEQNIAFAFKDLFSNESKDNYAMININGEDKSIKNDMVLYYDNYFDEKIDIYSQSENVKVDEKYYGMRLSKYRLYNIYYRSEQDKRYISGRVLSGEHPVSKAVIKTSSKTETTDHNGYFKIPISANEKNISIINNGVKCSSIKLEPLASEANSLNDEYIGRLQCEIQKSGL